MEHGVLPVKRKKTHYSTRTFGATKPQTYEPFSFDAGFGFPDQNADGEFPLVAAYNSIISSTKQRYEEMQGSMASNVSESSAQMIAPIAFTLRDAYFFIDPAPGASSMWSVMSRIDGASGNIFTTWSGATDTGGNDLTHSDSVSAGQLVNWSTDPTNSPATTVQAKFSAVAYITPSGGGEGVEIPPDWYWFSE